jgi:hypothetical protein
MNTNSKEKNILIEEIKEAIEYMKLVDKGQKKTQSLKDLLSEL